MKLIPNLAEIDRRTIEEYGIPGLDLMEAAGYAIYRAVRELSGKDKARPIAVVCGGGNNGGDGYVCARLLAEKGYAHVTVIHTATSDQLPGDAKINFERLIKEYPEQVRCLYRGELGIAEVRQVIREADILVDGLFGSGLSREVAGVARDLIGQMNRNARAKTVAIDLPSGIDGATGQVRGRAVLADVTVTFATGKPGLYLMPGKAYAGEVRVVDIGIPQSFIDEDDSFFHLITDQVAKEKLPKRDPAGHKYTFGSVLVVAGSRDMPGAAVLTSHAVLSAGAGLVTLAAPESIFGRIDCWPEIMRAPLPETEAGRLEEGCLAIIDRVLDEKKISAVAIGPGLGHDDSTVVTVGRLLSLLSARNIPVVVDADGLNCLAALADQENPPAVALDHWFILTPHVGEAARLLKRGNDEIASDVLRAANDLREVYGTQVVLKSASTVCALSDDRLWINPTGNAGMATAGSGDVLTGIIAGLAAWVHDPAAAAIVGTYCHGLAGDIAAERYTAISMRAGHITDCLPDAFKRLGAH